MQESAKVKQGVNEESWESFSLIWREMDPIALRAPLFMYPSWLNAWWQNLGNSIEPLLLSIRSDGDLIGLAPLWVEGSTARFLGSPDVCDYLDFIVAPNRSSLFFNILIAYLRKQGIVALDLVPIREDSISYTYFGHPDHPKAVGVWIEPDSVSYEMDLPDTWDAYLQMLDGKQRHEIRRKFRRLHETARVDFKVARDIKRQPEALDTYLSLFRQNRSDKAAFMTSEMTGYFKSLVAIMGEAQMLRLFSLDLDGQKAASVLCFDDGDTLYLYNNGYDNRFNSLSIGIISKALTIEYAIQNKKKRYDFLKGAEPYKHHLGGKPVALYRCRIDLMVQNHDSQMTGSVAQAGSQN